MRAMGGGGGRFKAFRSKGVRGLAWASMGAALVGGPLIAGMFLGDGIDKVLTAIPWNWIPPVLLGIMFVVFWVDLLVDWEPNRKAIWMLLLSPSVARAVPGDLGENVTGWSGAVLDAVAQPLREWLGTGSPIALALFVSIAAVLMARRSIGGGNSLAGA
ncbi:hypothetical protein OG992_18595 [Micromonospora sp. NBC_00362]|uniref:hypothetical protein n=1 Tax=Micromonospora sp. NBC_00362 TaxID=2975975 RepID=UPI00225A5517|nr:hypothetical protein [Micromonospora sp. NBC_00362]MCX5119198.1 hypothetical protein [Micromonospora sp. NBC_00362]